MSGKSGDETLQGKEANDDWTGTMSIWGEGFEVEIKAEGNEARGEGPLVTAEMTVGDHIAHETELEPGDRANEHDFKSARAWADGHVKYTVTMHGDAEKVEEYADGIFESARSALPEDCERVIA